MISRSAHQQGTVITFRLKTSRPTSVVGDFNYWDPLVSPMHRKSDDLHELHLLLQPGRYAFRYLADGGEWFDEPEADAIEPNGQGGSHTLLLVK
jgi:1,4-alpha-glucan branching enzyme